jgi:hypothetical protein
MYRAPISAHTTMPKSTLIPKITCGCIIGSPACVHLLIFPSVLTIPSPPT